MITSSNEKKRHNWTFLTRLNSSQSKYELFYFFFIKNFKMNEENICHISLSIIFGWMNGIKRNSSLFFLSFFSYNSMIIVHKVNRYIFFLFSQYKEKKEENPWKAAYQIWLVRSHTHIALKQWSHIHIHTSLYLC
jgi:hypothetical protein